MSAALESKVDNPRRELLEQSLVIVNEALKALKSEGKPDDFTLNEIRKSHAALDLLIKHNPELKEDIEKAMGIIHTRESLDELLGNIVIAKDVKESAKIEGLKIEATIKQLRLSLESALLMNRFANESEHITEIKFSPSTTATDSASIPAPPSDSPEPEWDEEKKEIESPREKAEDERNLKFEFFVNLVGYENINKPVSRAIWTSMQKCPADKLEELGKFLENPDTTAAEARQNAEQAYAEQEEIYKDLVEKVNKVNAKAESMSRAKASADVVNKLFEQAKTYEDQAGTAKDELKNRKKALDQLPKIEPKADIEYSNLESRLLMINYYLAKKEEAEKKKPLKLKKIIEDTHKQLAKEEANDTPITDKIDTGKNWIFGIFRPSLKTILASVHKEDDDLSGIDEKHFMELTDVANKDKGVKRWLGKLVRLDNKEGKKENVMENLVPKLMAHLEVALNEGKASQVNMLSVKYTKELLKQFRGEVRAYSLEKAKTKEGGAMDKLGAYFDSLNKITENKQEISTDVVFGLSKKRVIRNVAKTAIGAGALVGGGYAVNYVGELLGPYAATITGGALVGGYLGIKGAREKDPKKSELYKKWGIRAAVLPALAVGAGALGITSKLALTAIGTAGFFLPNFIKHRKSIFGNSNSGTATDSTPTPAVAAA